MKLKKSCIRPNWPCSCSSSRITATTLLPRTKNRSDRRKRSCKMPTLVFPLSRIEGHARVSIEVQGGEVASARLEATELRGFQYLVHGVPAEQMPVIVTRICGVCSTAHHVAAVKTLEDIYGVTPPPVAQKIRELLMLGQLIQNQATSLFFFTMPDRLGLASLFQLVAEQEGPEQEREQIARNALT